LISKFMAEPPKQAWPHSVRRFAQAVAGGVAKFTNFIFQPFIPYKSKPGEPESSLPEEAGDPTDEQLAQCQTIFDQSEARRAHIEQKAQWAFTVIAFLMPSLASVLVFIIRDPTLQAANRTPLVLLSVSACLLLLSFVSAARALAIRGNEILHLGAVIEGETGCFRKYDKGFHAQGLLYCATMNTATNDHIAQFVKGAHVLMAFAVIAFTSGAVAAGLQLTAHPTPPIRAEVIGTVSLSPTDLSGLRSDIRELAGASAARAAATSTENQLKVLADRMAALEAEMRTLQNPVPITGHANPAHSTQPRPSAPTSKP
jgi:hypothetical protein